ncbi:hypothetical protein [Flavobacterium sp. KACC 22761]|uniref:hypothetical protein n=1 Tax=Flavobacterium sp. KACC 22761 TaxID=3092665 RepID=UPI002A74FB55|nr:hypothetical protein [Flavobacterium sp. KACC 22761]WPO79635.1 hypothetical protein SCB73_04465 [Flavobacterium sp. KACC 22761]
MKLSKYLLFVFIALTSLQTKAQNVTELNWTGTLNNKIPISLSYSISNGIITGEIIYLNTKNKTPIKVIGTVEDDKSYRILEFEKSGNISGIITGKPTETEFVGDWFSPKSRKSLSLKLANPIKKQKMLSQNAFITTADYHYGYSEKGSQGDFQIEKLKNGKFRFSIFSVTSDPARNIANIDETEVNITRNSFVYSLPEEKRNQFKVTFYPEFEVVKYTKGDFEGQFGHNATIEGIYLKVK